MLLKDFVAKHVPGLYNFNHFEHPCGAFIQARVCGTEWVYRDSKGNMRNVYSLAALKELVEADEPADLQKV